MRVVRGAPARLLAQTPLVLLPPPLRRRLPRVPLLLLSVGLGAGLAPEVARAEVERAVEQRAAERAGRRLPVRRALLDIARRGKVRAQQRVCVEQQAVLAPERAKPGDRLPRVVLAQLFELR